MNLTGEITAVFAGCLKAKVFLSRTKRISWQKWSTFIRTNMPHMKIRKSPIPIFSQTTAIPKLTLDMKSACQGNLTVKEFFYYLQSFENCKSPGEDGRTAEFCKQFWNSIGHLLVDSLSHSYDTRELSKTQEQAINKLIEKRER